jgi:acetyl esterase/lipase
MPAGMPSCWACTKGGAVEVQETTIPSAGREEQLPVLILTAAAGEGPFSCVYYTANGAKTQQGSRVGVNADEAKWVAELGVAFISIAPRVGPTYPHPAQVEDAYAGLVWINENAKELSIR